MTDLHKGRVNYDEFTFKNKTMNDLSKKYSKAIIAIHWISAILILSLFPLGKYMEGLTESEKMGLIKVHAILGVLVFILTLLRIFFFFKHERPSDLKTGSKFNDKLAVWIHNLFYFLLIGICLSGIASMILGGYGDALSANSFELIKSREEIVPLKPHEVMSVFMMIFLALHVVGVIKHFILKKENTLKRIS